MSPTSTSRLKWWLHNRRVDRWHRKVAQNLGITEREVGRRLANAFAETDRIIAESDQEQA